MVDLITSRNNYSSSSDDEISLQNFFESKLSFFNSQLSSNLLDNSIDYPISVYPQNIKFNQSFPNKVIQQKVIISSSCLKEMKFLTLISGERSDFFSLSEKNFNIKSGSTYTLIITFKPRSVGVYNVSLILEGEKSIIIPMSAHCLPSPLEFPHQNSNLWLFQNSNITKEIPFSNKSFSMHLHIDLSINSHEFTIEPRNFIISPMGKVDVSLSFFPDKHGRVEEPCLIIKCNETGDFHSIPLLKSSPRTNVIVDFGTLSLAPLSYIKAQHLNFFSTNSCTSSILRSLSYESNIDINLLKGQKKNVDYCLSTKKITLKEAIIIPHVDWPFILMNRDELGLPQSDLLFGFGPNVQGAFQATMNFNDFDITLKGKSIDSPYELSILNSYQEDNIRLKKEKEGSCSDQFINPLKIKNISSHSISLYFSVTPHIYFTNMQSTTLNPSQSIILHFGISLPTKDSFLSGSLTNISQCSETTVKYLKQQTPFLFLTWTDQTTSNLKKINDKIPLQVFFSEDKFSSVSSLNTEVHFSSDCQEEENCQNIENPSIASKEHSDENYQYKDNGFQDNEDSNDLLASDISFSFKKKWASSNMIEKSFSENFENSSNLNSILSISPPFISFFGVGEDKSSFEIVINSQSEFTIKAPSWIHFGSHVESGTLIHMDVSNVPQDKTEFSSFMIVQSICNAQKPSAILASKSFLLKEYEEKGSLFSDTQIRIPIFGYAGTSNLSFDKIISVHEGKGKITVSNKGSRNGFVAFVIPKNEDIVSFDPPFSVVYPDETIYFSLTFSQDSFDLNNLKLQVFFCDDIIRQIFFVLKLNFFDDFILGSGKKFYHDELIRKQDSSEILSIADTVIQSDCSELRDFLKNRIEECEIEVLFHSQNHVNVSPSHIEYSPFSENYVTIYNNENETISFFTKPNDDFVNLIPKAGVVSGKGSSIIKLNMKKPNDSSFQIFHDYGHLTIPITYVKNHLTVKAYQDKNMKEFNANKYDKSKNSFVKSMEKQDEKIKVEVISPDAISTFNTFSSQSNSLNLELPVEVKSEKLDEFDGTTSFESFFDQKEFSSYEKKIIYPSKIISFPQCSPSVIRRATVRIANYGYKKVIMKAIISKPFRCPVPVFEIEPNCYILLPVHFSPTKPGNYGTVLEIRGPSEKKTCIQVNGKCI